MDDRPARHVDDEHLLAAFAGDVETLPIARHRKAVRRAASGTKIDRLGAASGRDRSITERVLPGSFVRAELLTCALP